MNPKTTPCQIKPCKNKACAYIKGKFVCKSHFYKLKGTTPKVSSWLDDLAKQSRQKNK